MKISSKTYFHLTSNVFTKHFWVIINNGRIENMIHRIFKSFCLLFSITCMSGNAQLLQNEWRDHLSYNSCYRIADVGEWVYCAAQSGLISYNKNTHTLRKHSKATGLSDVLVSTIAYSPAADYLIVGYTNGNIDLLREGESPVNLSDIKRKIMTADKKIYDIYLFNQYAYLSCGFGIVVLDLERAEFEDTYILGENGSYLKINDLAILGNNLYAATETGIFTADLNSENLLDYNNWQQLDFIPQSTNEYKQIENHGNKLFAVYRNLLTQRDKIITIDGTHSQDWITPYDTLINRISSTNGFLTVSSPSRGQVFSQNDMLYLDFVSYGTQHIYVTPETEIYVAATYSGFTKRIDSENQNYLLINGPRYSEVNSISAFDDQVWVSSGGPNRPYLHGAAYSFIDGRWKSYLPEDVPTTNPLGNTYKFAIDPRDPSHVYAATFMYGLIEFKNGEVINVFEKEDLELFDNISDVVGLRIAGLQFDKQNNLWIAMSLVSGSLFKIDAEGNWSRPDVPSQSILAQQRVEIADLLITSHGQIWVLSRKGDIVVLEENSSGNFISESFNVINQYDTQFSLGYCLEEDNEGNVWVGTNNGPVVYYSPSSWNIPSVNNITGTQIAISRNDGTDNVDLLLSSNAIYDIEVDGGNRKWFGTDNSGVFLASSDGHEILFNLREDNSPLLSNSVTGIGINEITGEVFFATSLGLISYGGSAITGFKEYTDVYVYPNPVRPEYEGPITVTGLVENSIVKITDVGGSLVWETTSLGGQAIWDGRNFDGKRVASGVYLVMLATEDGLKSHITKLLFLH